jgi:hypothetical protein
VHPLALHCAKMAAAVREALRSARNLGSLFGARASCNPVLEDSPERPPRPRRTPERVRGRGWVKGLGLGLGLGLKVWVWVKRFRSGSTGLGLGLGSHLSVRG